MIGRASSDARTQSMMSIIEIFEIDEAQILIWIQLRLDIYIYVLGMSERLKQEISN
jgi:hypothetical protein